MAPTQRFASTASAGRTQAPSRLGDAVGLSDIDLLDMYRKMVLARALDDRTVFVRSMTKLRVVLVKGDG